MAMKGWSGAAGFSRPHFLLEVGERAWLISIFEGRIVSVTQGPFVMPSSAFALRAVRRGMAKVLEPAGRRRAPTI